MQIRRITVLGNRDPAWLNGYTILGGRVEVYDKDGEELFKQDDDGRGTASDFDFKFKMPLDKVRRIRFRALGDEGRENPYDDVAIGEIQVE